MHRQPSHVLLLEPYLAGSHEAWAHGYARASRLRVEIASLPGRFWKWRMHGASVTLARHVRESAGRPDVVLATDMLDLAAFLGLARDELAGVPVALYVHENQLCYPCLPDDPAWSASRRRRASARDAHYAFVNVTSALAADRVLWNSRHNRDSFLEALPGFLRSFPDYREMDAGTAIAAKSDILPLGLDLAGLDAWRIDRAPVRVPRVLWSHRWEHDKDPDTFLRAVDGLVAEGAEFELVLLGESFARAPDALVAAREKHGGRIAHFGFAPSRAEYAGWLWRSDVVVSTARHEFFGASVAEAVYCGCRPVLPNRLAYPDLIPAEFHQAALYEDFDGLLARLRDALCAAGHGPAPEGLRGAMAAFDWSAMAPRYDTALESLARPGTSRAL